ncbi:23587_t:CDS:2, partial [Dentiscutata erythropus]
MYSPESGGDDSDASTTFPTKSPESQNNESITSAPSPKNQSENNYQKTDIPPPTIEQTPTRFLASCSKLDLEPNPFEQSFSGVAPVPSDVGTNSPKPSLPPVSQIASPGIPGASDDQYGWSLQSLRSGALSPSMLTGPQDATLMNEFSQPGRTGTTPLPFGSFSDPFSNPANNFVNQPLPVLSTDPYGRGNFNRPLSDSDRKSIPSNPTTSAPPVTNVSTSQSGVIQPGLPTTNILNMTNGSSTSSAPNVIVQNPLNQSVLVTNPTLNNRNMVCAPQQDLISRNPIIPDTILPKTENDDFPSHSNNIITNLPNGRHTNPINTNIPTRKSSIMSDSMDEDSPIKMGSSSSMKSSPRSSRRKAEEALVKEQPPSKKNGQKVKNEMTDEEKRRNFLERNQYLTNDNENLQNQAQSLREEIINLKTLLLAHKDCPIAQANGVMGLDSIPPSSQGIPSMNGMSIGPMGMVPGGIPNSAMAGVPVNGMQGSMPISNVQVPPHMTNHVNGPP